MLALKVVFPNAPTSIHGVKSSSQTSTKLHR